MNSREYLFDNILIATYMGATIIDDFRGKYKLVGIEIPYQGYERFGDCEPCLKFTSNCDASDMEFHSNWSWLMPVYNKVKEHYEKERINMSEPIKIALISGDIKRLHSELVWFIKCYNKKKEESK